MAKRVAFFATPATANGAQSGFQNIATFDDFQARTLKLVRVIVPTAGLRYQIATAGRVIADFDSSVYTAAGPQLEFDQAYGAGIQFSVNVVNNSGGAVPANAGLQLFYEAASTATAGSA